jgi:hypothetical protein
MARDLLALHLHSSAACVGDVEIVTVLDAATPPPRPA